MPTQALCQQSSPFSQCGFPDVEPLAFLAHGLDDQVHVRMVLVRVQDQGIAMREGELLSNEVLARKLRPSIVSSSTIGTLTAASSRWTNVVL